MNDSLGDRMKKYEDAYRYYLPERLPVLIRVDGKSFHTVTRNCKKPYDATFASVMDAVAIALCTEIQGAQIAYVQSDEISILVNGYKSLNTKHWFENNINKINSIAAGIASSIFTINSNVIFGEYRPIVFDSRTWVLPKEEVVNYMIWRQNDATRNSLQMLAQSLYSQKQLHKKKNQELQEMCWQKGKNWNNLPTYWKRGRCAVKNYTEKEVENKLTGEKQLAMRTEWVIDSEVPIFTQDREYINKFI